MSLPGWIAFNQAKGYYTLIEGVTCQREKCGFYWFPRIDYDGNLKLNICPKCKSKLWNVPQKKKKKN